MPAPGFVIVVLLAVISCAPSGGDSRLEDASAVEESETSTESAGDPAPAGASAPGSPGGPSPAASDRYGRREDVAGRYRPMPLPADREDTGPASAPGEEAVGRDLEGPSEIEEDDAAADPQQDPREPSADATETKRR